MEYTFVEQSDKQRGHNWFGHEVKFYLAVSREMELFEFLEEAIGKRGRAWRMKAPKTFSIFSRADSTIRFASKSDAMRFKLSWEEDERPEDYLSTMLRKLSLNSTYGAVRSGTLTATAPTWNLPLISQTTPGILPTLPTGSGKTLNITQAKSRRYNPCNEIVLLDYESSDVLSWYDEWIRDLSVNTWGDYNAFLDMEIRYEERSKQAEVGSESTPLQAGLFLSTPPESSN